MFSKERLAQAYSYQEYLALTDRLLAEKKTTGENQSEAMINYTKLNRQRIHRIEQTCPLDPQTQALAQSLPPQTWVVLAEPWCGDVAQNLPTIHLMAQANPNIELRIMLRDENPDIMDAFLTNGGKSIPKLIALSPQGNVLGDWGPRPAHAQAMMNAYKQDPQGESINDFVIRLQKWYNEDKTLSLQAELRQAVQQWSVQV